MTTNDSYQSDNKFNFKKGMTLSDYMNQISEDPQQTNNDDYPQTSEDLYETCLRNTQKLSSTKIIPFNIPQMDEDNYQSSVDCSRDLPFGKQNIDEEPSEQIQTPTFSRRPTEKKQIQITTMYNPKKTQAISTSQERRRSKDFRIKNQSNSPFQKKIKPSPQKGNFSKTLYGNTFFSNKLSNASTASSTIYQNKLTKLAEPTNMLKSTIHSRESKNEKYFHNKNKKQLESLIQYENNIRNKYSKQVNLMDIRVDGFRDKMYERKNRMMY